MEKTVAIACDHAGFALKGTVISHLEKDGWTVRDCGTYSDASCDYPEYASAACREVVSGVCTYGILICGTGVGMSIAANKFDGIRAACCSDTFSARFTRLHNDANVLCFGAKSCRRGTGPRHGRSVPVNAVRKFGQPPETCCNDRRYRKNA